MFIICKSDGGVWLIEEIKFAYDIVKGAYKLISSRKNQEEHLYFHNLVKELANENETYRVLVESAAKEVMPNNQDSIEMLNIFSSSSEELYGVSKNKYNSSNYTILSQALATLWSQRRRNQITQFEYSHKKRIIKNLAPLLYLSGEVTKLSSDKFNYSSECLDNIMFSKTDSIDRILRNRFDKSLIVYSNLDSSEAINVLGYPTEYLTNLQSVNLDKLILDLLSSPHEKQAEVNKKMNVILKGMEFLDPQKKDADLATIEQYINHEEPNKGPKLMQSFIKYREYMCINLYLSSLTILAFKEKSFPEDELVHKIHSLDNEYGQQLNI